jgi:CTP:molybdopterin cytidylyltransferase MocA
LVGAFNITVDAVVPQYQSNSGHPVLLSGDFLRRLAEVSPSSPDARLDLQIRALPKSRTVLVSVDDEQICINMNTLDEFIRLAKTR